MMLGHSHHIPSRQGAVLRPELQGGLIPRHCHAGVCPVWGAIGATDSDPGKRWVYALDEEDCVAATENGGGHANRRVNGDDQPLASTFSRSMPPLK